MVRVGALDHPVERSSHSIPTPKGGGVGIVIAFALGMLFLYWYGPGQGLQAVIVIAAALFLGAISFLDDLFDWPFIAKLTAQIVAALIMMLCTPMLNHVALPGDQFAVVGSPAWWPALVTLGWFLFVTNAVNFMDGLNGLASGSVAIAMLALAAGARATDAAQALVLVAAIAGFLPFNYPRARIFMGDVGSQVCGFLAADMALLAAPQPRASIVVPLALLPMLLDVGFTLARRARRGARLTQAHRGHLYQVANRAGMPAWRVTLIYWAMAGWGGVLGLAAGKSGMGVPILVAAAVLAALPFALWGLYVSRAAKRAEFTTW